MKKHIHLFVIVLVVWLMMIFGFYFISRLYHALLLLETHIGNITINIILVAVGTTMVFIWLLIWKGVAVRYFESFSRKRKES